MKRFPVSAPPSLRNKLRRLIDDDDDDDDDESQSNTPFKARGSNFCSPDESFVASKTRDDDTGHIGYVGDIQGDTSSDETEETFVHSKKCERDNSPIGNVGEKGDDTSPLESDSKTATAFDSKKCEGETDRIGYMGEIVGDVSSDESQHEMRLPC
jgi:hypothetical protein